MNEINNAQESGFFQRVTGIFADPAATFHIIAKNPDWYRPLILVMVVTVVLVVLSSIVFLDETALREKIESDIQKRAPDREITAETVEKPLGIALLMTRLTPVFAVVGGIIWVLLISGIYYSIYIFLMDADLTYKQTLAVTCYVSLINGLKGVLSIIMILIKGGADLNNPAIKSDLTLLFGSSLEKGSLPDLILGRFDLFGIWSLVLMIIGFSVVGKISRTKSAIVMIILFVVASGLIVTLQHFVPAFSGR